MAYDGSSSQLSGSRFTSFAPTPRSWIPRSGVSTTHVLVSLWATVCSFAPLQVALASVSAASRNVIVAEHNAWRAEVGAPPLEWDDSIAQLAQDWADWLQANDGCNARSGNVSTDYAPGLLGENLYGRSTAGTLDPSQINQAWSMMSIWTSQKADYVYGHVNDPCTALPSHLTTRNYIRLTWTSTRKIGCGIAHCSGTGTESLVWVCRYFPADAGGYLGLPFCEANVPAGMSKCASLPAADSSMACGTPCGACTVNTPCSPASSPACLNGTGTGWACPAEWEQCGGRDWAGATCCVPGSTCTFVDEWYSQCIPGPPQPLSSVLTTPGAAHATPTPTPAPASVGMQTPAGTELNLNDTGPAETLALTNETGPAGSPPSSEPGPDAPGSAGGQDVPPWVVIAAVAGGSAALLLCIGTAVVCWRRRRRTQVGDGGGPAGADAAALHNPTQDLADPKLPTPSHCRDPAAAALDLGAGSADARAQAALYDAGPGAAELCLEDVGTPQGSGPLVDVHRIPITSVVKGRPSREIRNAPGHWDVFFSYHQTPDGKMVGTKVHAKLSARNLRTWYDEEMDDKATEAMLEGVRNSKAFVLFMTEFYLDREFCRMELAEAVKHNKRIVVVYKPETQHLLGQFFARAETLGFEGIGNEEAVPLIFNNPAHTEVTIATMIAKCELQ